MKSTKTLDLYIKGTESLTEANILKAMKEHTMQCLEWLTNKDAKYAILYGGEPVRFATIKKDLTIEELYDEFNNE